MKEKMNGIKHVSEDRKDMVSVFLTCVSCGKVEEIHVFRERGLVGKVYWECLTCQRYITTGCVGKSTCLRNSDNR
jgi:hypothetical protein